MKRTQPRIQLTDTKKAMSEFEIIGFAILAIVVIIISVAIFLKFSGAPSQTIGNFANGEASNTNDCIKNPATCVPFQSQPSTTPPSTKP